MARARNRLKLEARRSRAYASGAKRPSENLRLHEHSSLVSMRNGEPEPSVTFYDMLSTEAQRAVDEGHFSGHQPGCTLRPELCQILAGIPGSRSA